MVNVFRQPAWRNIALFSVLAMMLSLWIVVLNRGDEMANFILHNHILPRMGMAILAGMASALASALLQNIMRNPLASDGTLAVGAGAQTALLLITVFAPAYLAWGGAIWAFVGAILALLAVLYLAAGREWRPLAVVLAGMVMSLYLGAISGAMTLFFPKKHEASCCGERLIVARQLA